MATAELFLDESGYTGPDLIDQEQPVFTLDISQRVVGQCRSPIPNSWALINKQGSIVRKAAVGRSVSNLKEALTTIKNTLEAKH